MARLRIHRLIAQALLGLLLFAWLPAIGGDDSPFADDLGQVLALVEPSDGGDAEGETCPGALEDGGGLDDVVLLGSSCRLAHGGPARISRRELPGAALSFGLPAVPQATGPPRFSN